MLRDEAYCAVRLTYGPCCSEVESSLFGTQRIVNKWIQCSQDLTGLQWVASHHTWEGRYALHAAHSMTVPSRLFTLIIKDRQFST